MNLIRILILVYLIVTPILFVGVLYLTVRTRNIMESRIWLKKYFLPMFLLLVICIFNISVINKLFPSFISEIEITCVSNGDLSYDIENSMNQSFIGLIEIHNLEHIEYANVFEPSIVGYTNQLFYQFQVVKTYKGSVDDGLLDVAEHQPAFLIDEFPCAQLEYQERLDEGIYLVYMDERTQSLPYLDQWYDESVKLFSFQLIEDYDIDVDYEFQDQVVKDQIERIVSDLASE